MKRRERGPGDRGWDDRFGLYLYERLGSRRLGHAGAAYHRLLEEQWDIRDGIRAYFLENFDTLK